MDKKVIIFDMDGTLVDSSLTLANAINYVRDRLYLPPLDSKDILSKINDHTVNAAMYFYKSKSFLPIHEKLFSQYYSQNHHNELILYKGIMEMLEILKESGYRLAVATNAYRKSTLESLSYLEIIDFFDSIVCFDDVKEGKPSPDMLFKVMDDINCFDALFVGDGERDMIAAMRAKVEFLMVNWGFSNHKNAISSVEELTKKILKR